MSKFVPKHINHKFQHDYINLIEQLKSNNTLNIRTIIPETQKLIDGHVESYYKVANSTKQHQGPNAKPPKAKPRNEHHHESQESGETKIIVHVNNDTNSKSDVTKLTVENEVLKAEIDRLNQIIANLYKEKFDLEHELKVTLEGIAN